VIPSYDELVARAADLLGQLRAAGLRVATAESCTGGLIASILTEVPGSSDVFERGFVTYSNAAKSEALGVSPRVIDAEGAVSEAVARAMASGALAHSAADVAVAVTGVAGPGGGSTEKPVGLVHLAMAVRNGPVVHRTLRTGDVGRSRVRRASVAEALNLLQIAAERG
jgi:nicotinamide-nucleotide amidase